MSNDNIKYPYRTDWQNYTTCCLDISLFNRYQEDLYLASMYKWVSDRFQFCIINVGDTLHRHNLMYKHRNEAAAHSEALLYGDEWVHNNKAYLSFLTIPHDMKRSDDWLAHPDFEATHDALWDYYYNDRSFYAVVQSDIESFVARRTDLPAATVRQSSLNYLLEETAADIILGREKGVAHLYPGHRHSCYGHLVQANQTLPDILKGLENSAFKRLSPSRISMNPDVFLKKAS